MTVNTTNITSGPYTGNNTTDVYSYTFRVEDKTQVSVYETTADGVETQLVVDTDYTVNDLGNDAGGTITRTAGNLPDGYLWYIRSDYKDTQLTEFASQGGFLPTVHESAMDKITFLIQQLQDRLGRAVRVSDSYPEAPIITMPDPEAGKALVWNNDADGIVNGPSASESAGASFVIETQTATEGQTVFVISKFTYVPGTGNLSVFINGVWQSDFIETDGSTVTLTEGLTAGDEVSFISGALVSSATPVDVSISRGTVSSAKAYTHTVGTEVVTQGYYTEGDGGGATYLVKTVIAYGGTPDGYGDHATDDGDFVLVLQLDNPNVRMYGAKGNNTGDDYASVDAAAQYASTNDKVLVVPAGIYPMSAKVTIIRPASDFLGFQMTGEGRSISTFVYTGAATFDYFFEIDFTSSFSLHNSIRNIGIDVSSAPNGTGGIRLHAGIWRSNFKGLYVRRDSPVTRTGNGIYMGDSTALSAGSFDNKFQDLYVSGFDRALNFLGTDLSGNTVTNTTVKDSYISNSNYNVYVDFSNGFYMSGTQVELHQNTGLYFGSTETAVIMGGSIESPQSGAIGIDMDANTKGITALCDFYNNPGGNFLSNGQLGHQYKSAQSGYVYPAGSRIRIDSDGTDFSDIRFFENGVADVRMQVADTGDAVALTDSAGVERVKFSVNDGVLDLLNATGYIRLRDGADIRYFQSGVTTRDIMGSGTPEGVVTANPGSTYRSRGGGAGTTFYVKETGTGNTGWVAK